MDTISEAESTSPETTVDCWNQIGTSGDGTCPELEEVVHCRNCPVFSREGRTLFDRPPPDDYIEEWKAQLAKTKPVETGDAVSAIAFRLGREWVALKSAFLEEIVAVRDIHTIPHRTNAILLGMVNVRGELLLCASISQVLRLEEHEESSEKEHGRAVFRRMVVASHSGDRWVFPVDEVDRIRRISASSLEPVPVTIARAATAFSQGIFIIDDRRIALLDEELLFSALRRSLHWQTTT